MCNLRLCSSTLHVNIMSFGFQECTLCLTRTCFNPWRGEYVLHYFVCSITNKTHFLCVEKEIIIPIMCFRTSNMLIKLTSDQFCNQNKCTFSTQLFWLWYWLIRPAIGHLCDYHSLFSHKELGEFNAFLNCHWLTIRSWQFYYERHSPRQSLNVTPWSSLSL